MHYVIRIVVWDINWHFIDTGITSCLMIYQEMIYLSECELNDHQLAIVNNLLLGFISYEITE